MLCDRQTVFLWQIFEDQLNTLVGTRLARAVSTIPYFVLANFFHSDKLKLSVFNEAEERAFSLPKLCTNISRKSFHLLQEKKALCGVFN